MARLVIQKPYQQIALVLLLAPIITTTTYIILLDVAEFDLQPMHSFIKQYASL